MILKIDNSNPKFYNIMGRYFADKRFIKEMDCQFYDDGFCWYLYYQDDVLCGFASIEPRKGYYYLDNFYVFEQFRNCGIGTQIVQEILKDRCYIRLISKNPYAIKIFEKNGFQEYGHNGQYKRFKI